MMFHFMMFQFLELKEALRPYSPNRREGVFSETGVPVFGDLPGSLQTEGSSVEGQLRLYRGFALGASRAAD